MLDSVFNQQTSWTIVAPMASKSLSNRGEKSTVFKSRAKVTSGTSYEKLSRRTSKTEEASFSPFGTSTEAGDLDKLRTEEGIKEESAGNYITDITVNLNEYLFEN